MQRIENRTFDELRPGTRQSLARTLTYKDIELFAIMSGDVNPAHLDEAFAKSDMFHKVRCARHVERGANIHSPSERSSRGPAPSRLTNPCIFGDLSAWVTRLW